MTAHSNHELTYQREARLPAARIAVTSMTGIAWIAAEGVDYIVNPGETIILKPGHHPAMIACLSRQPLTYEVKILAEPTVPRLPLFSSRRVRTRAG